MKSLLVLALVLASCASCPASSSEREVGCAPAPTVAPSTARSACDTLAALGCREGLGECVVGIDRLQQLGSPPLACWSAAKSKSEARACGRLDCP